MMKDKSRVNEGDLLWTPSPERIANTNLANYQRWLKDTRNLEFPDYQSLWEWSVKNLEDFWESLWKYFEIESSSPYEAVLPERKMPGAKWFPGARLNYAQHMLRRGRRGGTALYHLSETTPLSELPWEELANKVRIIATQLRNYGVKPGDRVISYMPNIPETIMAMLATTSIGAIWSSCSPDFGTRSVLDRFEQIAPKVMFCVDGYSYGGKPFDRKNEVIQVVEQLDSLERVIFLPYLNKEDKDLDSSKAVNWEKLLDHPPVTEEEFHFEQVPFEHPLWILFSSGTTGLPKAIVHSHGGILLEQLKLQYLQKDSHEGERLFFFTTTGWMMWNYLASSLLIGVKPVLYDGNPAYPEPDVLWKMVEDTKANIFGASPTYVQIMENAGIVPKEKYDLSTLNTITLAGSPVSPESMVWIYNNVKEDLWVAPGSGGTDVCSGFVEGVPGAPVRAGVIQGRALGAAVYAFNDAGEKIYNEVGELVITEPMPSMPIYFWGDKDNKRYLETYFDDFPGIWRHGDFFKLLEDGGCFVLGRSDATLNRYGIRIGTAEIYRTIDSLDEVEDSLIINLDLPGGKFFMPLFVKLKEGLELNEEIEKRICQKLRSDYSPRHVPDKIFQVDDIPYTLTRKKMEVPVRKILLGMPVEKAANTDAMANPASLNYFINYAKNQDDYRL